MNQILLFVVLPSVLAMNALCVLGEVPDVRSSGMAESRLFLKRAGGDDSWGPMQAALAVKRDRPDAPVYQTLFFEKGVKFQYPMSSLLSVAALEHVVGPAQTQRFLNRISFVCVWITALLCGLILTYGQPAPTRWRGLITMFVTGVLVVLFYPVVKGYTLGQIQAWLCALFVGALYLAICGRWRLAGLLVGIICTIKPQLALVILWAMVRRRWAFAGTALLVAGAAALLSTVLYGGHEQIEYLRVLRFIGERGESYYPNQSVNGLLNRLLFNGNNLEWSDFTFPAPLTSVKLGTMLTSAALILTALFWRREEHERAPVIDLCIIGLTATIASPVAWEHHYGILVGIYAATLPLFLRHRPWGRATGPLLLVSFVVAASFIPAVQRLAASRANVLQSYLFFAALLLLVMLYALRGCLSRKDESGAAACCRAC